MTEAHFQLPDTINPSNFPAKLWRMVNNPANSAIYWDNSGEAIFIDQQLFEQLILTSNSEDYDSFKTTHFSSFVRQLNLYGFRKAESVLTIHCVNNFVTSSEKNTIHHFYNPNFKRNNPALLANLKRLTVDNKAKIDSGIDVKCRPPSKNPRPGFGESSLVKRSMRGESSSLVRERKDSPHPYRRLPMGPPSGTLVPPHHLPHVGHPFAAGLSTLNQQGVRCGVNYGTPNFTGIHVRNEQFHPGFYSPAIPCYPPALTSMPHGMQTGPFMPIGYFPACYPLMNLDSNDQRSDTRNKNKEGIKKADINLDTVFQIADEVMQTQPNNNLIKIVVPEKESTSDEHTVVSDPVQTPKEALIEETKESLDKIEVMQVEISNTSDSKSCQV